MNEFKKNFKIFATIIIASLLGISLAVVVNNDSNFLFINKKIQNFSWQSIDINNIKAQAISSFIVNDDKKEKESVKQKGVQDIKIETSAQPDNDLIEFNEKLLSNTPVLLASSTTTFYGSSPERIHNIKLGTKKVSDVIVKPGEVYSFLEHLGEVSEQTGYKKAYVISAGSTVKEAGGGICQVSTTLFRAAINAGLPIVQRRGHGYVVSYYGPGLDATIYGPYLDFKFINDTAHPIKVVGKTTDYSVTFEIWGVPDGREVYISDVKISNIIPAPKAVYIKDYSLEVGKSWCPEKPAQGMDTEVDYIVKFKTGEIRKQKFITRYKAWGKKCYIGAMQ